MSHAADIFRPSPSAVLAERDPARRARLIAALAQRLRLDVFDVLHAKQTGHWGGSASSAELLTALYFEMMRVRPEQPAWPGRDRLVLSKGHAAPMLYAVLAARGFFRIRLGRFDQARQDLEQSRTLIRSDRHTVVRESALLFHCLGVLAYQQGDLVDARDQLSASLVIFREVQDQLWALLSLDYLGEIHRALGDYQAARTLLQEAIALHRQGHDQLGTARALLAQASVLTYLGQYADAKQMLRASLELCEALHLTFGIAIAHNELGRACCGLKEYSESRDYFRAALKTAMEIEAIPLIPDIIVGLAELLAALGRPEHAVECAISSLRYPSVQKETSSRADRLLATLKQALLPPKFTAAREMGTKLTVAECLEYLSLPLG
jgi:tetratricopeptide (TPR) repeat protein